MLKGQDPWKACKTGQEHCLKMWCLEVFHRVWQELWFTGLSRWQGACLAGNRRRDAG